MLADKQATRTDYLQTSENKLFPINQFLERSCPSSEVNYSSGAVKKVKPSNLFSLKIFNLYNREYPGFI